MERATDLKEKPMSSRWLWISTCLYLFLFPFLLYFSLFSFMAFDNPHMTVAFGLLFIFLFLSVPFSIPLSIFLMWRRYYQKKYSKACFHCSVPVITAFTSYFFIEFLGLFV